LFAREQDPPADVARNSRAGATFSRRKTRIMMHPTRRQTFIATSAVALVTILGGKTRALADTAVKGDGGTIRLMVNMATTQTFPAALITQHGLDQKYGFKLETVPSITTQTTTTNFQTHNADIGLYGWNDLSRVKAGGVKVVGINPFLDWANTLIVPVGSPIKTLADLKGKKVGLYSRTNLDWVVMRALAQKKYNLDLETAVDIQEGAISLLRGLMEEGKLDATQMFADLTAPMIVGGKFRVLATIKDYVDQLGVPNTPFILYSVDTDYAAAHPGNVKAFVAAYREAIDMLESDDSVWAPLASKINMTDDAVVTELRKRMRPLLMKSFPPNAEANIRKMWDILLATAGAEKLGMSQLVPGFMTLQYQ
jgi:NitT/TauT family transport system substrate-binding protein